MRSLRLVNDRVNELAMAVLLAEAPLVALMLVLGNGDAAFVCLAVMLLAGAPTNVGRRDERNAIVELRPRLILARVLGLPVLQLAVDEIESAMRLGPREALLRAGARKVVLELHPESPPEDMDALFAHLQVGTSRAAAPRRRAPTVAIDVDESRERSIAIVIVPWLIVAVMFACRHGSRDFADLPLAISYGVLVAGQILVLARIAAYMDHPTLTIGEHELTIRRRGVDRILGLEKIRAIELVESGFFASITIALVDGSSEQLVPLAREETVAVARALEQRMARSRRVGAERRSEPPPRDESSRASEAPPDVIALERSFAFDWLGGVASMVIGADGLLLRRGHKTTFVPFAELRAVSVTPVTDGARGSRAEILLHAEDGRSRVVGTSREPMDVGSLSLRLAQAVRAHHGEAPAGAEQLARGNRSIAEWRAELAAARSANVPALAFRRAALEDEHLHEILTSARASLDERVGAALALRQAADARSEPELRMRIGATASATVDPRLREALEVVAADEIDDERLAAALVKTNE